MDHEEKTQLSKHCDLHAFCPCCGLLASAWAQSTHIKLGSAEPGTHLLVDQAVEHLVTCLPNPSRLHKGEFGHQDTQQIQTPHSELSLKCAVELRLASLNILQGL